MNAQNESWRGIYPALCTPFTPDGDVDLDAQRRVARFCVESGAHGLVAFGMAGEVLKLTSQERMALTDVIVEEAGSLPVFVGVGAESVGAACELARHAQRAGADCVVVPAPVSARPGEAGLVDYFVRIAAEVSVPVMIQDAAAYLGVALGPALVERVGSVADNVRLVKLEAGPSEMLTWLSALGDEFSVWGGDGGIYQLDCLRIGAAGIIPGSDVVDLLVEIFELEQSGESSLADERYRRVLPLLVFQIQHGIDHYNACAKYVLTRRGILSHSALRQPASRAAEHTFELLERHLSSLDLGLDRAGVPT